MRTHGGARRVGTALLVAGILLSGLLTPVEDADAGPRRSRRLALTAAESSPRRDAKGKLRVKRRRHRVRARLKLRGLEPRAEYDVVEDDSREVLARFRTSRRGKARVRLSTSLHAPVEERPDWEEILVVECGSGESVLEVIDGSDPPEGTPPEILRGSELGFAAFGDDREGFATVTLSRLPEHGVEAFSLFVGLLGDPAMGSVGLFELTAHIEGDRGTLPLGVGSVRELAGRPFEVLAADGSTVVAGRLPELVPLNDPDAPFDVPSPMGLVVPGPAPLRLRIESDGGFADAGELSSPSRLPPAADRRR